MTKNLASGWTVDQVNALSLENKRLREELDALRARVERIPWRKAAEFLAYDIWHYERPNYSAVGEACQRLDKAKEAMESAGFKIVLPELGEIAPDA